MLLAFASDLGETSAPPAGIPHPELAELEEESLARSGTTRVAMADPLMHELTTLAIGASPHLTRGNAAAREGRLTEAEAAYRQAVAADAANPRAHQSLGTVLVRRGNPQAALEHFGAAVALEPENARAHSDLGVLLGELGQNDRALEHQGLAWLREATVLMGLGRFAAAKGVLEARLGVAPADERAAQSLARLLAGAPDPSLRDGPRAFAIAGALLEADNTAPKAETAAMALAEVGRFEEAIDIQRTLVQEARRLERGGEERRLARNLERYERGEACCARVADVLPPY